ncbi:hypothetical protein HY408_02350 [Candidatus Gottesmanbacteria bacterium]|nr:hypothetical protein [Candidatus Gottesmanbacteria bacterium]
MFDDLGSGQMFEAAAPPPDTFGLKPARQSGSTFGESTLSGITVKHPTVFTNGTWDESSGRYKISVGEGITRVFTLGKVEGKEGQFVLEDACYKTEGEGSNAKLTQVIPEVSETGKMSYREANEQEQIVSQALRMNPTHQAEMTIHDIDTTQGGRTEYHLTLTPIEAPEPPSVVYKNQDMYLDEEKGKGRFRTVVEETPEHLITQHTELRKIDKQWIVIRNHYGFIDKKAPGLGFISNAVRTKDGRWDSQLRVSKEMIDTEYTGPTGIVAFKNKNEMTKGDKTTHRADISITPGGNYENLLSKYQQSKEVGQSFRRLHSGKDLPNGLDKPGEQIPEAVERVAGPLFKIHTIIGGELQGGIFGTYIIKGGAGAENIERVIRFRPDHRGNLVLTGDTYYQIDGENHRTPVKPDYLKEGPTPHWTPITPEQVELNNNQLPLAFVTIHTIEGRPGEPNRHNLDLKVSNMPRELPEKPGVVF